MKYIALFIIVLFCSCNKNADSISKSNAIIVDEGQSGIGGCGWIVRIDSVTQCHPDNLSAEFQKDNLKVNITYNFTKDTFDCGDIVLIRFPIIHILTIEEK